MSDLVEFLLARIAEDEAGAREAAYLDDRWEQSQSDPDRVRTPTSYLTICRTETDHSAAHIARFDPARVLAECEAKRRIIEAAWKDYLAIEWEWGNCQNRQQMTAVNDYPEVVRLLALPYADHPDYREEWRP